MIDDLKIIKKKYGEEMMHFCRESFPTILEQPGSLSNILLNNFEPSRFLYVDIIEQNKAEQFKSFIYELFDSGIREVGEILKTPAELLSEAGYILYECHTEEDIQKFRKYYAANEKLCTFNNHRLNDCYVFFAVKNNVEDIRRENFSNPKRQDEYGTSVISIQFSRNESHLLSIKNRYNHTVPHPDATFSNNLDNIIEGLTDSFAIYYGMSQAHINKFDMDGYVLADDGKYYKYNYEINNIYYCPNNIIIDNGRLKRYEKEKYLIIDYFILNLERKRIDVYDRNIYDSFLGTIGDINRIATSNEGKLKKIIITPNEGTDITIILDDKNRIIEYTNFNVVYIRDNFLKFCSNIKKLTLPNVLEIKNYFCYMAKYIEELELPKVEKIGNNFLAKNVTLKRIYLPKVVIIGDSFCFNNDCLEEADFPNLEQVGSFFLSENTSLKIFNAPKLKKVGDDFLYYNLNIVELNLPSLEVCARYFFYKNFKLKKLYIPNLQEIGTAFCDNCIFLDEIDISNASPEKVIDYINQHFAIKSRARIRLK